MTLTPPSGIVLRSTLTGVSMALFIVLTVVAVVCTVYTVKFAGKFAGFNQYPPPKDQ